MNSTEAPPTALEIQANRFAVLSRLADDLAHEIRNPLNAIVINLEVLRGMIASGSAERALGRVDVIGDSVHRTHMLVDRLLQLLRPAPADQTPVAIDDLLDEVVPLIELQARLCRIEFRYTPCGVDARAHVRRDAFRFALLNVTDALIASLPGGGVLSVTGECAAEEVRIRLDVAVAAAAPAAGDRVHDRAEAGIAFAHALLAHAGGRVECQSDAVAGPFLIVLPRVAAA